MMLWLYKQIVSAQYEASLWTMDACIVQCPDEIWFEPVSDLKYCQVVFHALFFTDACLGPNVKSMRDQPFHLAHKDVFSDYEELEYRKQVHEYEKDFTQDYLRHCRRKATDVIAVETEDSLRYKPEFEWLDCCRAELHVRNIRHISHHAAQLSLKLRLTTGIGIPWCNSGWNENPA